ncbi:MAG: hypothetical protein C7B43_12615 [Sulfobacillus benefaciens]|jgi:hypothetical protein|uniref:Uncharacterized protein n=1 Tax=Sulfobacillus benefaciens TaxID=453960 RepID=A0A2T2WXN4_9FIRM|nr:MAG: hypothetical protein C7B43_12615 [Sulfobacillus benefaciens]
MASPTEAAKGQQRKGPDQSVWFWDVKLASLNCHLEIAVKDRHFMSDVTKRPQHILIRKQVRPQKAFPTKNHAGCAQFSGGYRSRIPNNLCRFS